MIGEEVYNLKTLFEQLGLPSEPDDIKSFIEQNPLSDVTKLHEADIWTPQQAAFLKDGIENDANWAEIIDELNLDLHKST